MQVTASKHLTTFNIRVSHIQVCEGVTCVCDAYQANECLPFESSRAGIKIRAYVYTLQVDNQLPFAVNPIIFYPYPPSPTVASKFGEHSYTNASTLPTAVNITHHCIALLSSITIVLLLLSIQPYYNTSAVCFIAYLHWLYTYPSAPKPFVESTIIMRKTEQSNVNQLE